MKGYIELSEVVRMTIKPRVSREVADKITEVLVDSTDLTKEEIAESSMLVIINVANLAVQATFLDDSGMLPFGDYVITLEEVTMADEIGASRAIELNVENKVIKSTTAKHANYRLPLSDIMIMLNKNEVSTKGLERLCGSRWNAVLTKEEKE